MPSQLEALLQQARSGLANTNSSLLNNRYPVYPGQTRPEMSAMTARKRQIEDQYRLKRPSFTRAIQHNAHRTTGFKEGDVQGLLDRISTQQQNLGRFGTQRIKNTFGDTYSGNLEGKINKDTLAKNAQSKVGFDNLANEARNIDVRDNNKTLQTLNALSLSKNATKEGVLGLLEQLGNQKHAYDQSKFNADRAMFNRQVNYPYTKIQGVGDAISGGLTIADAVRRDRLNAEQGGEFNPLTPTPSEERYAESRLRRGMAGLNTNYPVYPGKLVADLNPDMKLSYNLAERLEPNIQDNSYEERRRLRKGLTDGDITSKKALATLNDKASPLEQNLDKDAQRLIKQVTAKINASRVMNGTFGSKSHQSELDAAIRDIVGGKYGSRANITTDTLNRSLADLSRENDVNNERVRELDRTGTREISDAFNQIRNINQRGVTDWGNEQNRLNQAFQQFSDEADWENNNRGNLGSNPQNRGLAIASGIDRAGSQSPLVLPSALQFNNLPANIPFEESKVAAPTTDPAIQRTTQLFGDEEEARRIADAAREGQNREELARREAELAIQNERYKNYPPEIKELLLELKRKRKEALEKQGATMMEVPAMSETISSLRNKNHPIPRLTPDQRSNFGNVFYKDKFDSKDYYRLSDHRFKNDKQKLDFLKRYYPEAMVSDANGYPINYAAIEPHVENTARMSNNLFNQSRSDIREADREYNRQNPVGNGFWSRERETPFSSLSDNLSIVWQDYIAKKLRPTVKSYSKYDPSEGASHAENVPQNLVVGSDFFGSENRNNLDYVPNPYQFRKPLNTTKLKLLTPSGQQEYLRKYQEEKNRYETTLRAAAASKNDYFRREGEHAAYLEQRRREEEARERHWEELNRREAQLRIERQAREAEERQRELEQQRRQDPENFIITLDELARHHTGILNAALGGSHPMSANIRAAKNNPNGYIVTGYDNGVRVLHLPNGQMRRL